MAALRREPEQAAPPPVCETRFVSPEELADGAMTAAPHARLIYATGDRVPEGPTKAKARALAAAGIVRTHQRRAESCTGWEFIVVKEPEPIGPRAAANAPRDDDPFLAPVLEALQRCVAAGRRAYSDFELARIAGLPTRHQAAWRVRKLAEAGRIVVETQPAPDRTLWRVIVIGGKATARPPRGAR